MWLSSFQKYWARYFYGQCLSFPSVFLKSLMDLFPCLTFQASVSARWVCVGSEAAEKCIRISQLRNTFIMEICHLFCHLSFEVGHYDIHSGLVTRVFHSMLVKIGPDLVEEKRQFLGVPIKSCFQWLGQRQLWYGPESQYPNPAIQIHPWMSYIPRGWWWSPVYSPRLRSRHRWQTVSFGGLSQSLSPLLQFGLIERDCSTRPLQGWDWLLPLNLFFGACRCWWGSEAAFSPIWGPTD